MPCHSCALLLIVLVVTAAVYVSDSKQYGNKVGAPGGEENATCSHEVGQLRQRVRELEDRLATAAGTCADSRQPAPPGPAVHVPTSWLSAAGNKPDAAADDAVRAMYEELPYPPREPEFDSQVLVTWRSLDLPLLSARLFGGRLLSRHNPPDSPLRFLVAGCGTGDAIVALARLLSIWAPGGQIVAVERSSMSLAVARRRVDALRDEEGLRCDVKLVQGSLLDLASLEVGEFDVIDCSGVLHHLPDPVAGLASLAQALKPGGALSLMVYAAHGRRGVYTTQMAMRLLSKGVPEHGSLQSAPMRAFLRQYLRHLPQDHSARLACPNTTAAGVGVLSDASLGDCEHDAVLTDTFLHAQDRAYTVGCLAAAAAASHPFIVRIVERMTAAVLCVIVVSVGAPAARRALFAGWGGDRWLCRTTAVRASAVSQQRTHATG